MVTKAKLQNAVDDAFKKLDALAVTAVFTNKTVSTFDFSVGEIVAQSTTYTTRGFIEAEKSEVDNTIANYLTLIVKTGGVDFNAYTVVTIDSIAYNCSILTGNEYATTFKIVRVK